MCVRNIASLTMYRNGSGFLHNPRGRIVAAEYVAQPCMLFQRLAHH